MTERGPALVRIALLSLVLGALALALVQPTQAGSEEAPEVTDPSGDVEAPPGQPDLTALSPLVEAAAFGGIDILKGYVQGSNTTVLIGLVFAEDVFTSADDAATYTVTFNVTVDGTKTPYNLTFDGEAATGPAGTAAAANGVRLNFTVPVAAVNASAGATLADLRIATVRVASDMALMFFPASGDRTGTDSAGPGTTYTFTAPPADDRDADGILDDCEERYFNGTAAQSNRSADLDNDTLTIEEECARGSDPTKADTDGDGVRDDQDTSPTDPSKGGTSTSSTSGSRSSTSGTRSGSSTTASGPGTTGNDDDGDVEDVGDAIEKLQSDLDYLGTSAGGMVAVLILAILALAVRWSL